LPSSRALQSHNLDSVEQYDESKKDKCTEGDDAETALVSPSIDNTGAIIYDSDEEGVIRYMPYTSVNAS
jgi:hypothetical protein